MAKWRVFYKTDGTDGVGYTVTNSEADSASSVREEVIKGSGDTYVPQSLIVCIYKHG